MTDDQRSIRLEVEVAGTPEEVWRAIATGPGISSWYVPHTVEEHQGGAMTASFGSGPEMQIAGRVAAWEPPNRIVFDKGEGAEGLAFEWLIEARDGGTCVVRLVSTGFGTGEAWDAEYDGMLEGWKLFLLNLRLHLQHFRGQSATCVLPMTMWAGTRESTWTALTTALGIPASPAAGTRVLASPSNGPALAGTVVDSAPGHVSLLLDEPGPGTAILAAEGAGDLCGVSICLYFYGPDGAAVATRDEPRWQQWLTGHAPSVVADA